MFENWSESKVLQLCGSNVKTGKYKCPVTNQATTKDSQIKEIFKLKQEKIVETIYEYRKMG